MGSQSYNLSGFTRLNIQGVFRFEVVKADSYGITVDDGLKHTRVFQQGDTLVVDHPWYDVIGWFTPWIIPQVKVQMPDLFEMRVSGASNGSLTGFQSVHDFKLDVRGASHLTGDVTAASCEIYLTGASTSAISVIAQQLKLKVVGASKLSGSLKADRGEIEALGASKIGVSGGISDATIKVAGASHLDLAGFSLQNANIRLLGASHCTVDVKGKLDAEIAGASRLVYGGNPVIGSLRAFGASTISPR